ncbi:MAG: 2-oxo-4-hydroxy-4-carboxy-5-ureidoimidazoline decarboxylase, partial [Actinomycetes bacterium]
LDREDRLEACAAQPRFGDRRDGHGGGSWSREEQAASRGAAEDVAGALDTGNRDYEARFGHVFLINATGLRAEDVLDRLNERLGNDPDTELEIAATEQQQIMDLRLDKLLRP